MVYFIVLLYYFLFAEHKDGLQPYFMTGFLLSPVLIYTVLLSIHFIKYRYKSILYGHVLVGIIEKGKIIEVIEHNTILSIIEYSTNRLPWSRICIWKLTLNDGRIIKISSVLITKRSVEKNFKIDRKKTSLFPF